MNNEYNHIKQITANTFRIFKTARFTEIVFKDEHFGQV